MFIVLTKVPRADAPSWSGRVALAAVDAVVWPALWIALIRHLPVSPGVVGVVGYAVAALSAVVRLQRAVFMNHRYWFTTWRWGKVIVAILFMGGVMKIAVGA